MRRAATALSLVLVVTAAGAGTAGGRLAATAAPGAIVYSGGLNCRQRVCDDPKYNSRIFVIDQVGAKPRAITTLATDSSSPAWSPDRRSIVFTRHAASVGGGFQLYVMNADGTGARKITKGEVDTTADWAPDGKRIVFRSDSATGQSFDIYVVGADGRGRRNVTHHTDDVLGRDPAWSPNGKWIAFERERESRASGVYVIHPDGTGLKRIVLDANDPAWSPNGSRIAFVRYESGKGFFVWVATAAGQGQRRVVEGTGPVWAPDGKRLAFLTPNGQIAVVPVAGGRVKQLTKKSFSAGDPDW